MKFSQLVKFWVGMGVSVFIFGAVCWWAVPCIVAFTMWAGDQFWGGWAEWGIVCLLLVGIGIAFSLPTLDV